MQQKNNFPLYRLPQRGFARLACMAPEHGERFLLQRPHNYPASIKRGRSSGKQLHLMSAELHLVDESNETFARRHWQIWSSRGWGEISSPCTPSD